MCVSTLFGYYHILLLRSLGFTIPQDSYFSIQIGFEFMKVQVNRSYLTYC